MTMTTTNMMTLTIMIASTDLMSTDLRNSFSTFDARVLL